MFSFAREKFLIKRNLEVRAAEKRKRCLKKQIAVGTKKLTFNERESLNPNNLMAVKLLIES